MWGQPHAPLGKKLSPRPPRIGVANARWQGPPDLRAPGSRRSRVDRRGNREWGLPFTMAHPGTPMAGVSVRAATCGSGHSPSTAGLRLGICLLPSWRATLRGAVSPREATPSPLPLTVSHA